MVVLKRLSFIWEVILRLRWNDTSCHINDSLIATLWTHLQNFYRFLHFFFISFMMLYIELIPIVDFNQHSVALVPGVRKKERTVLIAHISWSFRIFFFCIFIDFCISFLFVHNVDRVDSHCRFLHQHLVALVPGVRKKRSVLIARTMYQLAF